MIWDLLDLTDRDTTPKRPPKGSKISLKHLLVSSSLLWSMFGLVPAALFFSLSPVTGPGQRAQSEGSWGSGQSRWRFSWLPLIPDDDIKVQGPQSGLPHPLGGFSTIFHLYHSMHYLLLRGLSSNGFFYLPFQWATQTVCLTLWEAGCKAHVVFWQNFPITGRECRYAGDIPIIGDIPPSHQSQCRAPCLAINVWTSKTPASHIVQGKHMFS